MNIVFLSFYSGQINRGAETFVTAIASRLNNHHTVTVIQSGKDHCKRSYKQVVIPMTLESKTVDPASLQRKLGLDYYYRNILVFTLKALSCLLSLKPDVIIPINGGWQVFLVKIYCLIKHCKMVVSGQAGLGWDERWNLLLKPNLYVPLTVRNLKWGLRWSPAQKMIVIPNGVDTTIFSPVKKRSTPNINDIPKPIIVCVGGPESYKRITDTIHAVAKMTVGSLIVVGGSNTTQDLGSKLLGNRFKQIKVEHDEMPEIYNNAAVFTLVSETTEAFGTAYVEALACGLPVVAPDDELRREIIGEAGLYVKDPSDYDDYAKKLEQALNRKWGVLPREQAKKYDWDIIANKYEEALNQLVGSS